LKRTILARDGYWAWRHKVQVVLQLQESDPKAWNQGRAMQKARVGTAGEYCEIKTADKDNGRV
jgi:hypothetical protein